MANIHLLLRIISICKIYAYYTLQRYRDVQREREIFWRARISIVYVTMHTFFHKNRRTLHFSSLSLLIVGCNVRFLNEITSIVQIAQVILFSPWFSLNIHAPFSLDNFLEWYKMEDWNLQYNFFVLELIFFFSFFQQSEFLTTKNLCLKKRGWRQIKYSQ